MSPEVQRSLPPYLQITQHYREMIKRGELKDGDRLPSTRQIVDQWGVAHATAAKALSTLRAEGLVKAVSGGAGGTVVSVREMGQSPQDRVMAGRRWGRIYPDGEQARIVSAEVVPAPAHVAEALGVDPDAEVIRRRRITYRGDTPVSMSTSWFTGDLAETAPDLLLVERIRSGTPRYIEQQTGRMVRRGRDQFTAGLAAADVAQSLGIAEGSPVLVGRNWFRDQAGNVIEFGEYVSTQGRWQSYEYEVAG
ncbi:GntR family transcriptional regulator [Micromonospora qiuiae]|uniref:GntR family transcriptional regulator n=1 Tax=Micromonospora qiuiae TaxID=502268 RepID=A0ABQ4JDR9_9ACTN|nr:GntR family transcriptional regulator [Micromonospora qiuiae]GIJ28304.1 GntR family transcriptional regulator [Micromonospora qiuiae]